MSGKPGSCVPCGRADQFCCAEEACTQEDTFCDKGRCSACGSEKLQVCCPDFACDKGLKCLSMIVPHKCAPDDAWLKLTLLELTMALS